tara:strand:- start:8 stop:445 length:438 start_codon:yes stop_codon:yes gene_type:complete
MTTQPIPNTTDDLIAEIEAAMANATPGYWYQSKGIGVVVDHNDCGVVCETCEDNPVDAIYIAACNPSNVRQLIARIRELEQEQRWRDIDVEMPEEDVRVLVWCDDGADAWPDTASHHNSFFTDEYHELLPVTHWRPVTPPAVFGF